MPTPSLRTLSILACLSGAPAAFGADVVNGGFEHTTALSGWTTSGTVVLSTAAPAAPTEGTKCALITSANTPAATLATLLGTTTTDLKTAAGTTRNPTNGGAILQTITTGAGDALAFDWKFNNGEVANDTLWPDTCFVVIDGVPTKLATSGNMPTGWMPAWTAYTKSALTAGTHTVGFAVFNFNDFAANSQVAIDNVRVIPAVCSPADMGVQGGNPGHDNRLDNNDFVAFVTLFFAPDARADLGVQGGAAGHDGLYDNNDFVVFIDRFFTDAANCTG